MTKAADRLGFAHDEVVIAAGMTFPAGHKRKTAIRMGAGGVATMTRDPAATDGAAARMPTGQHFLAVTNYRLLATTVQAIWTNPKAIVAEWTIDEVRSISVEPGFMAATIDVVFCDGSSFRLDGARSSGAEKLDGVIGA